jgi:hypothetical protein
MSKSVGGDIPERSRSTLSLNAQSQQAESVGVDAESLTNQTRAQEPLHELAHGDEWDRPWAPPSTLSAPDARPGMAQRWVRTHVHGVDDVANVQKAMQEGWKPRRADTVDPGFHATTMQEGTYAGCIGVHGMVLCEMPAKRLAQRRAYYEEQTRRATRAVVTDLENQSRADMPIHQDRRSSESVGRIPKVAGDSDED